MSHFISDTCVLNLFIFYQLITKGFVSYNDFDITSDMFKRHIGNIRFMLAEYQLYHVEIIYNRSNNTYELIGKI